MLVDIPQEPFLDDFGELLLLASKSVFLLKEHTVQGLLCSFCLPSAGPSVHCVSLGHHGTDCIMAATAVPCCRSCSLHCPWSIPS